MSPEQFMGWLERRNQPTTTFEKPLIMGVLNVTPDSFSDGGLFLTIDKACEHALNLVSQGADLIDVGGESSKPNAATIPLEMELSRVIPVIERIRTYSDVCISIDTYKPEVMQAAIHAGANVINDIYALRKEGALSMAAKLQAPICLMHMQGNPLTMQENPYYPGGVVSEVLQFFIERLQSCSQAGISKKLLLVDPGFGFGKHVNHNLSLINHLDKFHQLNLPIMLGISRKSSIGEVLGKSVKQRLIGGISLANYAALKGVGILRMHDVDETHQALRMIEAICLAN